MYGIRADLRPLPLSAGRVQSARKRPSLSSRQSLRIACVPSSAETAKTIVSTVNHGTLSTLLDDGTPLGTYVAYVLDKEGVPVLRLRSDAVHMKNLERNPRCSLFVQALDKPERDLARVTLIGNFSRTTEFAVSVNGSSGSVAFEDGVELESIRERCARSRPFASGIDRLRDEDRFGRLQIERVFYVGGLDGASDAEEVRGEEFMANEPDPLRLDVPGIVRQWNTYSRLPWLLSARRRRYRERMDDIYRLCKKHANIKLTEVGYSVVHRRIPPLSGIPVSQMVDAELSWVDRLGFYVTYTTVDSVRNTLRLSFPRAVEDERDARSLMTMAAHLAWESDRTIKAPK